MKARPTWFTGSVLLPHVAVCLSFMMPVVAIAQEPSQSISREEVLQQMRQWTSQVKTLRVDYRTHSADDVRSVLGPEVSDEEVAGYYRESSFFWENSGATRLDSRTYRRNELALRTTWVVPSSTEWAYEAIYSPINLSRLIITRVQSSSSAIPLEITPLIAWYPSKRNKWLPELIQLPPVLVADPDEKFTATIDGATLTLDPENNFMVSGLTMPAAGDGTWTFNVDKFEQVEPGLPFPMSGTHEIANPGNSSLTRWNVTNVSINQEFQADTFAPIVPAIGTLVEDKVADRFYRHGDDSFNTGTTLEDVDRMWQAQQAKRSMIYGRTRFWWLSRIGLTIGVVVVCGCLGMMVVRKCRPARV